MQEPSVMCWGPDYSVGVYSAITTVWMYIIPYKSLVYNSSLSQSIAAIALKLKSTQII